MTPELILNFEDKVSSTTISGGSGDDTFNVGQRLTNTTILGGGSRDSVDVNENSESSLIDLGSDDDKITIVGKHTSLVVKGAANDDTLDIEGMTGSGNKFYAGKGEDSIKIASTAASRFTRTKTMMKSSTPQL